MPAEIKADAQIVEIEVDVQTMSNEDAGPLLPMRELCARYKVHARTIDRWLDDKELDFPDPIYINNRRYWRLRRLEAFERQRPLRLAAQA
jgi:predicted DNA-binding transcriptional regulator AlpA